MSGSDACTRLREADAAYHRMSISANVNLITDQNGERVQYNSANRNDLLAYIRTLAPQCPTYMPTALGPAAPFRPLRFVF